MPAGKARIRILSYDGTIDIPDLPHTSAKWSKWIQPQGSNQQSTQMGRATIGLIPSSSSAHGPASFDLTQLAKGQRVEIYEDSWQGGSKPKFTGIVDRLPQNRSAFTLEAADSLQVAANSIRMIPFSTSETADVIIKKYGIQYYKPFYVDTLSRGPAGYVVKNNINGGDVGTWAAATVEGMAGVQHTGAVLFGVLQTSSPYALSSLTSSLTVFDVVVSYTATTGIGLGIYFTDAALTAGWNVLLSFTGTVAPRLSVNAAVIGAASSTFDTVASPLPIGAYVGGAPFQYRCQVAIITKGVDAGGSIPHEVLINGQSIGAVNIGTGAPVTLTPAAFLPSGYISLVVAGQTPPHSMFVSNLVVLGSTPLFQTGTIGVPKIVTNPPQFDFNNHSCLAIIQAAAAQEGWTIYKSEGVGWGNDILSVY